MKKTIDKLKGIFQNASKTKIIFYSLFGLFLIYICYDLFFKIETYTSLTPPNNQSSPTYSDTLNKANQAANPSISDINAAQDKKDKKKENKNVTSDTVYLKYAVKKSETFSKIAARFNVKRTVLKRLNGFENENVSEKQIIKIPLQAKHTVKKGEKISDIASSYGVKKELILKANKLSSEKGLKAGKKLFIPFP